MKPINYKGYQASVEYDDGTLFIKILHISDVIIAECDKASDAPIAAKALIDDYIKTCEKLGRFPEKPFKGSLNIRISPEIHRKIAMKSASLGVSLNRWISQAIEHQLDCDGFENRIERIFTQKSNEHDYSRSKSYQEFVSSFFKERSSPLENLKSYYLFLGDKPHLPVFDDSSVNKNRTSWQ